MANDQQVQFLQQYYPGFDELSQLFNPANSLAARRTQPVQYAAPAPAQTAQAPVSQPGQMTIQQQIQDMFGSAPMFDQILSRLGYGSMDPNQQLQQQINLEQQQSAQTPAYVPRSIWDMMSGGA